jgi:hypothetical protein
VVSRSPTGRGGSRSPPRGLAGSSHRRPRDTVVLGVAQWPKSGDIRSTAGTAPSMFSRLFGATGAVRSPDPNSGRRNQTDLRLGRNIVRATGLSGGMGLASPPVSGYRRRRGRTPKPPVEVVERACSEVSEFPVAAPSSRPCVPRADLWGSRHPPTISHSALASGRPRICVCGGPPARRRARPRPRRRSTRCLATRAADSGALVSRETAAASESEREPSRGTWTTTRTSTQQVALLAANLLGARGLPRL